MFKDLRFFYINTDYTPSISTKSRYWNVTVCLTPNNVNSKKTLRRKFNPYTYIGTLRIYKLKLKFSLFIENTRIILNRWIYACTSRSSLAAT